jgi:hypothetical protein
MNGPNNERNYPVANQTVAHKIVVMRVDEIRDLHFYDAETIDDLPGIDCTGWIAPFDDLTTEALERDLYGWCCERLLPGTSRTLWHCPWQLAALVYSSQEIYLFTFDTLGDYEAHLTKIRASFRR